MYPDQTFRLTAVICILKLPNLSVHLTGVPLCIKPAGNFTVRQEFNGDL